MVWLEISSFLHKIIWYRQLRKHGWEWENYMAQPWRRSYRAVSKISFPNHPFRVEKPTWLPLRYMINFAVCKINSSQLWKAFRKLIKKNELRVFKDFLRSTSIAVTVMRDTSQIFKWTSLLNTYKSWKLYACLHQ